MQTTKWGPPGWCFLNSIVSNYPNNPTDFEKKLYENFFRHLGNMLPCIYCRQSYHQFINELPLNNWIKNNHTFMYNFYLLHNKVNDKLRSQGYLNKKNPSFESIRKKYIRNKNYEDCGWDFLYSIIYNYPANPTEVDKYNYKTFFSQLKQLMPYEPIKIMYRYYYNENPINDYLNNRYQLTGWFYSIHENIANSLPNENIYILPYDQLCQKYESFRANCSSSAGNSCRIPYKK